MTAHPRDRRRVSLLLEGTYPYVAGGVSTWVHQIIEAMPDVDFDLHFIGDKKENNTRRKYEVPANVASITESYLFDPLPESELRPGRGTRKEKRAFLACLRRFVSAPGPEGRFDALYEAVRLLRTSPGCFTLADLNGNEAAWELLIGIYRERFGEISFLRFQATIRDLLTLFWRLLLAVETIPRADVYHCICTGYAGLLGSLAARLHKAPLVLSEHGVYLKERIEDIRKSSWLSDGGQYHPPIPFQGELGAFRSLWIDTFDFLGCITYRQAASITALYRGNARLQVEFGADPSKVVIIPNGIDTARFESIARRRLGDGPHGGPVTIGFLGRVVPIKDVKTLLRAARLVLNRFAGTRFLIAGPFDEDPAYHEECLSLARQLGIEGSVEFPGRMNPDEFLQVSDIVVLTSISEGLPFAILEASAAGLPVVATKVGACAEMMGYGAGNAPDLGPSGLVTEVGSPAGTAEALVKLAANPQLRQALGANGLQRVRSLYRQEDIISQYRYLYLHTRAPAAAGSGVPAGAS
ncbi:MAG: GT4 family glycosyltransferase PelF [Akkermansiaceae bacterium]|nr:GT4 family glycosyltransferase PelF [Akkermansiaceae bacterium]